MGGPSPIDSAQRYERCSSAALFVRYTNKPLSYTECGKEKTRGWPNEVEIRSPPQQPREVDHVTRNRRYRVTNATKLSTAARGPFSPHRSVRRSSRLSESSFEG